MYDRLYLFYNALYANYSPVIIRLRPRYPLLVERYTCLLFFALCKVQSNDHPLRPRHPVIVARYPCLPLFAVVPTTSSTFFVYTCSIRNIVVEVSPEGFVMSKRCFKTLPELFKWFKGNAQQLGRSSRSGRKVMDIENGKCEMYCSVPYCYGISVYVRY